MIELETVSSGYRNHRILHDISCVFKEQHITAVMGPNGSGKTTLLKTICGIIPVMGGDIRIGGVPLGSYTLRERAKRIAYVPQSRATPHLSVYRLLLHGRFPYAGYPRAYSEHDRRIVRQILEQTGLAQAADMPVNTLSGGQKQQAYLAMALVQQTPVILFDEPTTFLDIRNKLETEQRLRELKNAGKTIIAVFHDIDTALSLADDMLLLKDGRTAACGTPEELLKNRMIQTVFAIDIETVYTETGARHFVCSL